MTTSWPEIALGEVAEINPRLTRRLDPDERVTFVPMAAVDATQGLVEDAEERLVSELTGGLTPFESGDVLVAKITPCFENGKIAQAITDTEVAYGSTEFHVVRAEPGRAHQRFLFHYLRQPWVRSVGERRMTGSAGQRRVPEAFLRELKVKLPPVEEQRRLAGVLDAANELRVKRRESLALLDSLTEAMFLDMFGDPVANPHRWPDPTVGGALARIEYGHRFYNESYAERGTRVVRITDVNRSGWLDFDAMPRMALTDAERSKYLLRPGDLIFARSGATVGKVALVRHDDPDCIAGAYFIWMRFRDEVDPVYAKALLASPSIQRIISTTSRQAAQQNFSGPAIKRLPMPLPPTELQLEFARRVQNAERSRDTHLMAAERLDELLASLQHRAFRGEL